MEEENGKQGKHIPFPEYGVALLTFLLFLLAWRYWLSSFFSEWSADVLLAVFFGVIVYLLFAYRYHTHILAGRITKEVYASREWFRNLYEYTPVPYALLSPDGRIRQPNKAMVRLYKETADTLYERSLESLFAEEDAANIRQYLEFFRGSLPVVDREIRAMRKDGTKRWVLLSILVLDPETQGDHHGLVALIDITDQKEVEQAKTEFVSLAAHQLRTPLASMKWHTEELLSQAESLGGKQENYAKKIHSANQEMIELVDLLLNVSRIELGSLKIAPQKVSPKALCEAVLESLSVAVQNKAIEVKTRYESIETFSTDPKLLKVVIENLLSNAVKYTPEGGTVSLSLSRENSSIKISVEDNGYGIPLEAQDKIFTKLFRAGNAQKADPDGNGLGLYLTKAIIESLGGSITFVSRIKEGSTFTVVIPPV